ncbi:hypothetical protein ACJZ2D_011269 [Fusarium nematophilum]
MLSNSSVRIPWIHSFATSLLISPSTVFGIHLTNLLPPLTRSAELIPHLPDEECEHANRPIRLRVTTCPSGSQRLTLAPDSSGTRARDRPVWQTEPMNAETLTQG